MKDLIQKLSSQREVDRRQLLWELGGGLGGISLAAMLQQDGLLAADKTAHNQPKLQTTSVVHHPPKAKRVVQLFMSGAASQVDTFDYKPKVIKEHGKKWDPGESVELFQSSPGNTLKAPWGWKKHGKNWQMDFRCCRTAGGLCR